VVPGNSSTASDGTRRVTGNADEAEASGLGDFHNRVRIGDEGMGVSGTVRKI